MFIKSCGHFTGTTVERVAVVDSVSSSDGTQRTVTIRRANGQERVARPSNRDKSLFEPGDSATWIIEWDLPYDLLGGYAGWSKYYFWKTSGFVITAGVMLLVASGSGHFALRIRRSHEEESNHRLEDYSCPAGALESQP